MRRYFIISLYLVCLLLAPRAIYAQEKNEKYLAPDETLVSYLQALKSGNRGRLAVFINTATLRDFDNYLQTPDQINTEIQTLEYCVIGDTIIEESKSVVRFHPKQKTCLPFLMEFVEGKWRIDLRAMAKTYTFNGEGEWALNHDIENEYAFGFSEEEKKKPEVTPKAEIQEAKIPEEE